MNVNRVERHIINKNHKMYSVVNEYCFKSKNLYNFANYTIRQLFIKEQTYIDDRKLSKVIKHEDCFKDIGSNSGQQTLKLLHQNWKSFFAALKAYQKNPSSFLGRPQIPKYLKKDGRYVWVLTNVQSKIINGYLNFSFKPLHPFNGLVKTRIKEKHMQTRFIPKEDHYILEIVYQKEILLQIETESKRMIGIDLGISRFATVQNNIGLKPFAINGGHIKSYNSFYNKLASKYRQKAKKINKLDWTNTLQRLTTKRNNKMDYYMHCASKHIVDYCINNQIDTVVIGYNEKWKQNSKMSKINNQNFTGVPFSSFVSKLEYKLNDIGIKVIKTEESYTSKASFLDNDLMIKDNKFSGKRIKRGLYRSKNNTIINADVNGASNIIKKVFPNAFANGIEGLDLHPSIVNIF
ncbi:RNA-guided endonuclease InsQ/TnpB family protein [Priestia megaterium]|uniref:RNA-guided endonuclease InsQ/TnpB family protein n=1 Tax=Priestia megaterium TaxID=1404 RepID=UPI0028772FCA|nr:transposase [Priestia megaterium]